MNNTENNNTTITVNQDLYRLLQRCSKIEGKPIPEILHSLLLNPLQKYSYNTVEQWEEVKEAQEMEQLVRDFQKDESFNPNEIPFDTQILGLRRKLDELQKEIEACDGPRPDLEKLKFNMVEDLNFAETKALEKQQKKRQALSEKWKLVCEEIPLS